MTGFIKPGEIHETQKHLVDYVKANDDELDDLPEEVQEFLRVHPVTKKKERKAFRYVNGVYITEEDFEESPRAKQAIERLKE